MIKYVLSLVLSMGMAFGQNFTNPILWQDLADLDIIRVDDVFYYSASTMHYSPGAPILRSYDLVNWEYIGHSVPFLDFGPQYDLVEGQAYVKGIWASFFNHRKSNGKFYWGGCIEFNTTYIYTADSVEGPWTKSATIPKCYYDAGLLVDDDDTLYVAYGNTEIHVAQLSPDGFTEVSSQVVFQTPPDIFVLEGSRFYKRNGVYYIFLTKPPDGQYILKSTTGPFGPYTVNPIVVTVPGPIAGGGSPHQGGMVETQNGEWYYMSFIDAYPGGRVPALIPVTWDSEGWPQVQLINNAWGYSYPLPNLPARPLASMTGIDKFKGDSLGPRWEWNHNPDNTKWQLLDSLHLRTATVTNDIYKARNTLTQRIIGPQSTATIVLDISSMTDGDRAGLALLRDSSASIGVYQDAGVFNVIVIRNITMEQGTWETTNIGTENGRVVISGSRVWLRVSVDISLNANENGIFSYSLDGTNFITLGSPFSMVKSWQFFMGYRFAIFNYASKNLGGFVDVKSFELSSP